MASSDLRLAQAAERIADALDYWVQHHKAAHAPQPEQPPAEAPAPVVVGEVPAGGMVPKEIVKELVDSGLMKEPVGGIPEPAPEAKADEVKVVNASKR